MFFQEYCKINGVAQSTAGMGGHKVGYEILLLTDTFRYLIELLLEAFVNVDMRLSHIVENLVAGVLGGNLKLSAYVVGNKLFHKFVAFIRHKIVVAYSRTDKYLFHALNLSYLPEHIEIFGVIRL